MAAGDLLSADWQLELRTSLFGAGQTWDNSTGGWTGLGGTATKTQDVSLDQTDGEIAGTDRRGPRLLTFPLETGGSSPATAMADLSDLLDAWAPSTTDVELHLRLPGWGHFMVAGRPRGAAEDLSLVHAGIVKVLATFYCPDPTITYL